MTVFLALSLALFLAAVFAFLELARVSGLQAAAQMGTLQTGDALLSEYQPDLWENYGVLFRRAGEDGELNISMLEDRQKEFYTENNIREKQSGKDYSLLRLRMTDVKTKRYELATDYGGTPFREQAALEAKKLLADQALEKLVKMQKDLNQKGMSEKELKELEKQAENTLQSMKDTNEKIKDPSDQKQQNLSGSQNGSGTTDSKQQGQSGSGTAGSKRQGQSGSGTAGSKQQGQVGEKAETSVQNSADAGITASKVSSVERKNMLKNNPIAWMKKMKKKGILQLVMPDTDVSEKKTDLSVLASFRKLNRGNYGAGKQDTQNKVLTKALVHYYFSEKFPDASDQKTSGALDYQMEYLLSGKDSDKKNLKLAVHQLLVMREGVNYVFLLKDARRQNEAGAMAAAISTALLNPELTVPIKHGILLAWAYGESISDVRILLGGGKLYPVKAESEWKTDLTELGAKRTSLQQGGGASLKKSALQGNAASGHALTALSQSGETGSGGFSKSRENFKLDYGQFLQLLLGMRRESVLTMRALDLIELETGVKMDTVVSRMDDSYEFQAEPIFWNYVWIGKRSIGTFRFRTKNTISYVP